MPGVTIYEKLSAVSNKQRAVTDRQQLIDAVTGLGGIDIDSDWQEVPVIYSNPDYNDVIKPVTSKLSQYNIFPPTSVVLQELSEALLDLNSLKPKKLSNAQTIRAIMEVIEGREDDLYDDTTGSAKVDEILFSYANDEDLTRTPSTTLTGTKKPYEVLACPLKDLLDIAFVDDAGTPKIQYKDTMTAVSPTNHSYADAKNKLQEYLNLIETQLTSIEGYTSEITTLRSSLRSAIQNRKLSFDTTKRDVIAQLNVKVGTVSQAIEFYDAVVNT